MVKIPKGSDVCDRMNLWYHRCNFSNPTLKIGQILRIFPEYCLEFHKLSNEYKLIENGVRSKEIRAKYGTAYDNTRWSDTTYKMTPSVHPTVYLS
jgi:hypothetical protein